MRRKMYMKKSWVKTPDYEGECRRKSEPYVWNGSAKLIWTLAISSSGVVFIGLMAWMTSMNTNLASLELTSMSRGERLAALETIVGMVDNRLGRMEEKIDELIQKEKRR